MAQEEKDLLLKDLLPRQLYGVKAHYQYYDFVGGSERLIQEGDGVIKSIDLSLGNPTYIDGHHVEMENIKPYLRPMSSMTVEEHRELSRLVNDDNLLTGDPAKTICLHCVVVIDFHNSHHFDYRGLIGKGLAIEVTEENNPYEN